MTSMIDIIGLGKKYKRYANRRGRIVEWLSGQKIIAHEARWVLRDITFSVKAGESLGIIGHNGAGKSTLLKILTGATTPTQGTIQTGGRIAALLELGMGFHPEFTGRQNAVMACQLMGIQNHRIGDLLPKIEAFAELGDYMDQPLRTYSSGMQMRLAFSTATIERPEILIIDEALSVGDAYFQHKSMSRIRAIKDEGSTLLFVSHDPGAVKSLCDRAILLDRGRLVHDGQPDTVLDYYNALIAKREKDAEIKQAEISHSRTATRSGNKRAEILKVEMLNAEKQPTRAFRVGDEAVFHCQIRYNEEIANATVGILIRDRLGNDIFGTNTASHDLLLPTSPGELTITFRMTLNLGMGDYSVTVASHSHRIHVGDNHDWWDQALVFQIVPGTGPQFIGVTALPVEISFQESRQISIHPDHAPRKPLT